MSQTRENTFNFDSTALAGLRGISALHIVLFHSLTYCIYNFDVYAQVHMPLFFLLSGFCMTLGYGKTQYDGYEVFCGSCTKVSRGCCGCETGAEAEEKIFNTHNYLIGRCTRILPIYWVTYLFGIPLIFAGHSYIKYESSEDLGTLIGFLLVPLLLIQTWIGLLMASGPDGPSWTVSTLFFFYFNYPWTLLFCQRRSNSGLAKIMGFSFLIEVLIGAALVFVPWNGYWWSTAWPISRYPVFLMGVCAGVLCQRMHSGDEDAVDRIGRTSDKNFVLSFIEDLLIPMPCVKSSKVSKEQKEKSWARRVDINSFFYFGLLLILAGCNIGYTLKDWIWEEEIYYYNKYKDAEKPFDVQFFKDGWFGTAGQLLFVQIQLMMIVGLCLDGGRSLFSKFYKTRIMQFLGRISMSLYLVHEPIIYYINWVYFGSVKWLKDEDSPTNFAKPDYVKMPTQYVPVHICISLLAGIFLTLCIEEPARKFLTKKLRKA